jgi:D-tagatose-1,6-bisphosphate aldolase subunit GatZ/KbaZ
MNTTDFFRDIVSAQKEGTAAGVASVCSAHPSVLDAAFRLAARQQMPVLIESTVNQVNQLGGYTGMTPEGFRNFVESRADAAGFPRDRIILGGDHLGPYPWRSMPAERGMSIAAALVAACVRAGYAKIHLDASMPLGDDPAAAANSPAAVAEAARLAAQREAELAREAEAAFREYASTRPGAAPPVYVIGTEVPAPGGVARGHEVAAVTGADELRQTVALCEEAFRDQGLEVAWERVIACVAQPGVEFDDRSVQRYDREKAADLCRAARAMPAIIIEGHSTDYQSAAALRQLVEDGVAILKVGPALTFAMRECLFGLEGIEREIPCLRSGRLSSLSETLDRAMLENPAYWKDYYRGNESEARLSRKYSFSDRCRYYWTVPEVRKSVAVLMDNLREVEIPLPLLSQHLPLLYRRVAEGSCAALPEPLVQESISLVLESYSAAATPGR